MAERGVTSSLRRSPVAGECSLSPEHDAILGLALEETGISYAAPVVKFCTGQCAQSVQKPSRSAAAGRGALLEPDEAVDTLSQALRSRSHRYPLPHKKKGVLRRRRTPARRARRHGGTRRLPNCIVEDNSRLYRLICLSLTQAASSFASLEPNTFCLSPIGSRPSTWST